MNKKKFEIGDKVQLAPKFQKIHNSIGDKQGEVIKIESNNNRSVYYVSFEGKKFIGQYYSYQLDHASKFKKGDKVTFTPQATRWLEGLDCIVATDDDLELVSKAPENKVNTDSKFHVGDKVILTEKARNWLVDRGYVIDLYRVYTIIEVTTFYGHSYRLKGINSSVCFFDDDLELFVDSKVGLTINEAMYNPRDEIMFNFNQRTDRMKRWVDICNEYLKEFCDRHDYAYHPEDWIGGEVGGIIEIADMFVTMDNIRYDVDNEIPTDKFSDWYWNSVEHSELGLKYMNYPSYCKGAPAPYTESQLQTIRDGQIKVRQAKEDLRKTMDELGGDFSKLLF